MSEDAQEVQIDNPKAVLDALERAKSDAKKYREQLEETQAALAAAKQEFEDTKTGVDGFKKQLIDLHVTNELARAGVTNPRVRKHLKSEGFDIDADGKLTGFSESLDSLKADLPELFDKKRSVGGSADAFTEGKAEQKLTSTDIQLKRLNRGHS